MAITADEGFGAAGSEASFTAAEGMRRRLHSRQRRRVAALGALLLGAACAAACLAGTAAYPPLVRLARGLAEAPPEVRAQFARTALEEMAAAYDAEAQRVWHGKRVSHRDRDARRWAAHTEAYAERLAALADAVTPATDVEIRRTAAHEVELVLPATSIIVSGPRIAEPGHLAERILARFCALQDCAALAPEPTRMASGAAGQTTPAGQSEATGDGNTADGTPAPPPRVAAVWTFSDRRGPTFTTADGLEFLFPDLRDLVRRREACAQVAAELRTLAEQLAQARARGVAIDWDALEVRALPGANDDYVRLNRDGEYLRLPLPALARAPTLLGLARHWLEAAATGRHVQQTFPHADVLLNAVVSLESSMRAAQ